MSTFEQVVSELLSVCDFLDETIVVVSEEERLLNDLEPLANEVKHDIPIAAVLLY